MAKGCLLGKMVGNTQENILMIKSMVKVLMNGQMVGDMLVNGKMENNMELVIIKVLEQIRRKKDNGLKEKESNGSKMIVQLMNEE